MKESTLQLFQPCRKAALLLWVKNPLGPLDHSPYLAAVAATQGETLQRFPPLRVICGCGMSQRLERSNVLLCRAWSADRGGGAERRRGWEKESTLQLWQPCRKAASRLTVNPFGSDEPLPLYRAGAATQGETLQRLKSFGQRREYFSCKEIAVAIQK